MGTGKLLRLYGNRKVVTFKWKRKVVTLIREEESCYVYMGRVKLLRLYGNRKVVTFIWQQES
jgi:hypothetical protein